MRQVNLPAKDCATRSSGSIRAALEPSYYTKDPLHKRVISADSYFLSTNYSLASQCSTIYYANSQIICSLGQRKGAAAIKKVGCKQALNRTKHFSMP